jgi:hypothetical protein
MRFPIKVVNILSGQFARQGLQFFKVNKSVTHVAVARPRYLDLEATPVSEGIRKIVDFINANPRTTRKKLMEALAPGSSSTAAQAAPAPVETQPAAEGQATAEGQAAEAASAPAAEGQASGSPEAAAVVSNLHWLVHQGHVIEFANGILETAKKPAPRPPKPEKQKSETGTTEQAEAEVSTTEGVAEEHAAAENEGAAGSEAADEGSSGSAEGATVQDESGASAGADVPDANKTEGQS